MRQASGASPIFPASHFAVNRHTLQSIQVSLSPAELADRTLATFIVVTQFLMARHFIRERRWAWVAVLAPLWLVVAIDVGMSFTGSSYTAPFLPAGMRSAFSAIGFVWGMTSVFSFAIYRLWRRVADSTTPPHSPERRTLIRAVGVAAAAAPFAVTGFGALIERTNFEVREIDLPVPGLHPDLEGKCIAQLSDLHVSPYLSLAELARVVDMTNELRPNLTVVTGDLITQGGDPLDQTISELGRLRAEAGVLGCLGNHERYCGCESYATHEAARYGIGFLRHQARQLRWGNGVLNVAGVDYQSLKNHSVYLSGAEALVAAGQANLLLSHNPDVFPVAVAKGYDTMLSGHTHGGQVTVEILNQTLNFARFATPYVSGLYRHEGRSCYVTRGIGTIAMPVRLGARPEITLARLVKA
jgi:predicted MPP superfamily phosphohydrolase